MGGSRGPLVGYAVCLHNTIRAEWSNGGLPTFSGYYKPIKCHVIRESSELTRFAIVRETMTVTGVQRRSKKKRRLVEIIEHAHRLDAIFPELEDNDEQFLQLIMLIWVVSENGKISMLMRRHLAKLFNPDLNFRADDLRFVSHRLKSRGISDGHVKWLCDFLIACFSDELRTKLVQKINVIVGDADPVIVVRQKKILKHLNQMG